MEVARASDAPRMVGSMSWFAHGERRGVRLGVNGQVDGLGRAVRYVGKTGLDGILGESRVCSIGEALDAGGLSMRRCRRHRRGVERSEPSQGGISVAEDDPYAIN